jgi:hypothetical protein
MPGAFKRVAGAQLIVAALLLIGIWRVLPARYLWVDLPGTLLAAAYLVSAVGLLARAGFAARLARAASWLGLSLGALTVTLLAFSLAHLAGQYGPVGSGGALLLGSTAVLVLPYLVGLPLLQLAWLRQVR